MYKTKPIIKGRGKRTIFYPKGHGMKLRYYRNNFVEKKSRHTIENPESGEQRMSYREVTYLTGIEPIELASLSGIPSIYISILEKGGSFPGIPLIIKLADTLKIPISEILTYGYVETKIKGNAQNVRDIVKRFLLGIPENKRRAVFESQLAAFKNEVPSLVRYFENLPFMPYDKNMTHKRGSCLNPDTYKNIKYEPEIRDAFFSLGVYFDRFVAKQGMSARKLAGILGLSHVTFTDNIISAAKGPDGRYFERDELSSDECIEKFINDKEERRKTHYGIPRGSIGVGRLGQIICNAKTILGEKIDIDEAFGLPYTVKSFEERNREKFRNLDEGDERHMEQAMGTNKITISKDKGIGYYNRALKINFIKKEDNSENPKTKNTAEIINKGERGYMSRLDIYEREMKLIDDFANFAADISHKSDELRLELFTRLATENKTFGKEWASSMAGVEEILNLGLENKMGRFFDAQVKKYNEFGKTHRT